MTHHRAFELRRGALGVLFTCLLLLALILGLQQAAQAQGGGTPAAPTPPPNVELRTDSIRTPLVSANADDESVLINVGGRDCREIGSGLIERIDRPVAIPLGVRLAVRKVIFPVGLCSSESLYVIFYFLYDKDGASVFQINVYQTADDLLVNDDILVVVEEDDVSLSLNTN